MMTVASEGARSAPKLAWAVRGEGNGPKRFLFSARWRLSRDVARRALELVARETTVSIARLSEWRERRCRRGYS